MSDTEEITGRQIAAARALLGMPREKLAEMAGVSVDLLQEVEERRNTGKTASRDMKPIVQALQSAGVSFIDDNQTSAAGGPGVRLLKSPDEFDTDQSQTVQYKEHLAPDAPTGAGG